MQRYNNFRNYPLHNLRDFLHNSQKKHFFLVVLSVTHPPLDRPMTERRNTQNSTKSRNSCGCNRKNAIKFGGFKKKLYLCGANQKGYEYTWATCIWTRRFMSPAHISEREEKRFLDFWRTIKQQEIDLIEECDGQISAFEYKWKPGKVARLPLPFNEAYPGATCQTITPDNYQEFV